MDSNKRYVCKCFYTNNYFLREIQTHVIYESTEQFTRDYKDTLGSATIEPLLEQLETERVRRRCLGSESLERSRVIAAQYRPLHPDVYHLQESFLDPIFVELVAHSKDSGATSESLVAKMNTVDEGGRIYQFPVFTKDTCQKLQEELHNFELSDLPKGRPNTMNNYGILLDELGFEEEFLLPLRQHYLTPLSRLLYPEWGGACLDSHKAFIVSYKTDQDTSLDYHFDNAEITINVALGGNYAEGELYFGRMRTEVQPDVSKGERYTKYQHRTSHGVLHRGQHMHGAMPISSGERHNLIIWMRSSQVRNALCPMCDHRPELVETEGRGDGYTRDSMDVCALN